MVRLLFFVVILSIIGCAEEPEVQRGDVVGKVGYYEKEFVNYIDSLDGVDIRLVGASATFETKSQPDGTFRFENVIAGNYEISMKKDFHAYYNNATGTFSPATPEFKFTHIGGGATDVGAVQFYEYPEYTTIIDSYEWQSDTVLILHLAIPPSEQDYYTFNIYLSEDESVGTQDFDFIWPSGYSDSYFEDAIAIDTTTGKIALKLPFYKYDVDHYFAVSATSVWSYDLAGPASEAILIKP